jgi:hypothetical protein
MKSMDFFVWQDAGGVNSELFTTSATLPDGKRRDFMVRLWVGIGIKAVDVALRRQRGQRHGVVHQLAGLEGAASARIQLPA